MAKNKVFNNEHPSNIKPESVFYGKMTSSGTTPMPKFTTGAFRNQFIDYGNQYTQVIRGSNTTKASTSKSGLMNK